MFQSPSFLGVNVRRSAITLQCWRKFRLFLAGLGRTTLLGLLGKCWDILAQARCVMDF